MGNEVKFQLLGYIKRPTGVGTEMVEYAQILQIGGNFPEKVIEVIVEKAGDNEDQE